MSSQVDFPQVSKCLECGGTFKLTKTWIECISCEKKYPIVDSIPRFVPSDNYASSFGYQWNLHSQTQVDKFNGTTISRDRLLSQSSWTPEELKGKRVLECGSGAGRFSQVLIDMDCELYSIDYSSAVEANRKNNEAPENFFLAQASIYDLPFKDDSMDYLVCLGVIQHTPDVQMTIEKMIKKLKPGGKFCIDAYASPISYLHPRHLLRPFTKDMKEEKLYRLIQAIAPFLLPISTFLHKIPVIGQVLARLIPVANWRSNIKLNSEAQYKEWAILDTFDWLSPAYENCQSRSSLNSHFDRLNLSSYKIHRVRGLYIITGTK